MPSAGSCLREMRFRHGVSLDEIARSTRVAPSYLAALESDDFSPLPPRIFTRGFIRAYCEVLNESPEEALRLYDESLAPPAVPAAAPIRHRAETLLGEPHGRGRSAVFVSFILLVALGLALVAVTIALQSGRESPAERRTDHPASSPPGVSDRVGSALPKREEPSVSDPSALVGRNTSITVNPPHAPILPPPATTGPAVAPYRLVARATELTWLRVRTADGRITEGTLRPGESREWVSNRPFRLLIGNAGGLTLELNGQRLPPLGASGAVIREFALPRESP